MPEGMTSPVGGIRAPWPSRGQSKCPFYIQMYVFKPNCSCDVNPGT